uniref:BED-type domain-containing protein n=1 Tax=Panagrellus redivivus TaxID=6233 RepID=A0A7E4V0Q4_PANRE
MPCPPADYVLSAWTDTPGRAMAKRRVRLCHHNQLLATLTMDQLDKIVEFLTMQRTMSDNPASLLPQKPAPICRNQPKAPPN